MTEKAPEAVIEEKFIIKDTERVEPDDMEEGMIYRIHKNTGLFNYALLKEVGEYKYIFVIYSQGGDHFGINFKTKEAEYAVTNINQEELAEVFLTIKEMVEKINSEEKVIGTLEVSPHDSGYTAKEITECKDRLLIFAKEGVCLDERISEEECRQLKKENDLNERLDFLPENLEGGYLKGSQILDKYREIFKIDFPVKEENNKSGQRSRLFRILLKRHMPDWEVVLSGGKRSPRFEIKIPD